MELLQLLPQQSTCRECELGTDSLNNPGIPSIHVADSLPIHPDNPAFIILGQNPGFQEDRDGQPFVGRSGELLRRTILNDDKLNLCKTHTVYLMNVARCCTDAGQSIPQKCYNTCYNLYSHKDLEAVIAYHKPKTRILATGKPASIRAYQLLFPKKNPGTRIDDYFAVNGVSDHRVQAFFTYHPAAILRENKLAIPYSEHLGIIKRQLEGLVPPLTKPASIPVRLPTPSDPTAFSIDIETYGALESMPEQTVFAPQKFLSIDGVHPRDAILSVAITLPKKDPRPSPTTEWTLDHIRQIEPGVSMTFDMRRPSDVSALRAWVQHGRTFFTVNGGYDIGVLRFCLNWQPYLHDQQIIDGIVLNFSYSEIRPEKSLKAFGILSGLYKYDNTIKQKRFSTYEQVIRYNAEDTHNTLLMCATLAADIRDRLPEPARSVKLTPFMLKHYSDLTWECIQKTEAGVPHDILELVRLARRNKRKIDEIEQDLRANHDLSLSGKGSPDSKVNFVIKCIETLMALGKDPTTHELYSLTEKGQISSGVKNRNLFRLMLPPDHELQEPLSKWQTHANLHKIYSTYCHTRLWCKANKHSDKRSRLIPRSPDFVFPRMPNPQESAEHIRVPPLRQGVSTIGVAHPTWYIVPSPVKDGQGASGGTIQGRPIAKNPPLQTDPPAIQRTKKSRWPGGMIVHYDFSQIEMRIAGVLSGDPSLIKAYQDDEDLHTDLTVFCEGPDILNDPYFGCGDRQTDPRQWYKQANFLIGYRGGWMTLLEAVLKNCNKIQTEGWARSTIDSLRRRRQGLWDWQEELIARAKREKRIDLPIIGMSRYFMGGDKHEDNEICNFPVQTWAGTLQNRAEILNGLALNTRRSRNPHIVPTINIYDAVEYDVRSEQHLKEIDEIMANTVRELAANDIYGRLCAHTGHTINLEYSREIIGRNEA